MPAGLQPAPFGRSGTPPRTPEGHSPLALTYGSKGPRLFNRSRRLSPGPLPAGLPPISRTSGNRTTHDGRILVSSPTSANKEPEKGFEPPTCHLQGGCSTTELLRRVGGLQPPAISH